MIQELRPYTEEIENMYIAMLEETQTADSPQLRFDYYRTVEEMIKETPHPDPLMQSMMLYHLALKMSLARVMIRTNISYPQ